MIELTPLAVSHKDVLRFLAPQQTWVSAAAISKGTGRDPSNVRRDLPKLIEAQLLEEQGGQYGLHANGVSMVNALNRVEQQLGGGEGEANAVRAGAGGEAPEGFGWFTHGDIRPDPKNARKHFDEEALGELADSMSEKGLLQKPAVRVIDGEPGVQLALGERRWRAWGLLIERGVWTADHRELLPVMEGDDAHAEEAGLIENLQRKDLKPLEEARGFRRLMDDHGHTTATIAAKVGFGQRMVQQRLQLLDLKPGDMKALEEGKITIEEARRRLANYPKPYDMPAGSWLMLLEMYLAKERARAASPDGYVRQIFADPSLAEMPEWKALAPGYPRYLVDALSQEYKEGVTTNRWMTGISYNATEQLRLHFGVSKDEDLAGERARARADAGFAGMLDDLEFSYDAFNGPFTLTPEIFAAIGEAQAARTRLAQEQQRRSEAHRTQIAEATAAAEAILANRQGVEIAPTDTDVAGTLDALTHPLPWRIADGHLRDARGGHIVHLGWSLQNEMTATWRLALAALNAAGGFAEPSPAQAEADLDREAFEQAMADRLRESYDDETPADALARAQQLLAEHLSENGVAYGDDGWVWNKEAAEELADQLDAEDMQRGEEDEEARMTGGSDADDLPDSLTRLAGVPAEAHA